MHYCLNYCYLQLFDATFGNHIFHFLMTSRMHLSFYSLTPIFYPCQYSMISWSFILLLENFLLYREYSYHEYTAATQLYREFRFLSTIVSRVQLASHYFTAILLRSAVSQKFFFPRCECVSVNLWVCVCVDKQSRWRACLMRCLLDDMLAWWLLAWRHNCLKT